MMNYADLIQKLFQVNLFSSKKNGLENCHQLDRLFDFPHRKFASIHVAGTNGKGSVSTKIAGALQAAGYKVGLYTSPHLYCFRERIRINDQNIAEEETEKLLNLLFETIERHSIPATFFEITTFLAFLYFASENVDFAVLETGLGGRLDATNVVHPLLSVITSISLDHTEVLGNTVEEIAKEKGGIIKASIPVVIGPRVPFNPIKQLADSLNCECMRVIEPAETFEKENCLVAERALNYLKSLWELPPYAIFQGLKARPACRMETISQNPVIIMDVAHNPDGLHQLFKAIRLQYPSQTIIALFGLSQSKDMHGCINEIAKAAEFFYPVEASHGKGTPMKHLAEALQQCGVNPEHICCGTFGENVKNAYRHAKQNGHLLVVCGTFYIMQEVRSLLDLVHNKN